jgi:hypothetical protein
MAAIRVLAMDVCFWSTTFQADNRALADHLIGAGWNVTVAAPRTERLRREPVSELAPFRGTLLERDAPSTRGMLRRSSFDLLIIDNHLPPFCPATHVLALWHGFGWRVDDLSTTRRELKQLIGDVTAPNPGFRFQAFGSWDRDFRIRHSRFAPENVVCLGSAYSDWLHPRSPLHGSLERRAFQAHYTVDLSSPVVLVALTWHHGRSLGHWGDEESLLDALVRHLARRGASCVMRMHDRHRYTPSYRELVTRVARRHPDKLMLKWKDESPDSLVDILVSDVCVSNYSSLLNAFYYTERPSIHVDPHAGADAGRVTYRMVMGMPIPRRVTASETPWKLPPSENGGLQAQSFEELLAQLERALADPACCRERSRAFVDKYIHAADGRTCERIRCYLERWIDA